MIIIKNIILYTTGCPRCNVLKKKLSEKSVSFVEETDVDKMLSIGITEAPVLSVDGKLFQFRDAVSIVNNL